MRILAFSDLHDDETAFRKLSSLSASHDFSFICGDISTTNIFSESVLDSFPWAFIIPGNSDNQVSISVLSGSQGWVHEKRIELSNGFNVVGFGLSAPTPYHTFGELSEEEIYSRMSKLDIDKNTLLLLHCPPFGYFDQLPNANHAGSKSILSVLSEKQPFAAFFGHIHQHSGIAKLNKSILVKLPAAQVMHACSIEIDTQRHMGVRFVRL